MPVIRGPQPQQPARNAAFPLRAEIALYLVDPENCIAGGELVDPVEYPPDDGMWLASVMFEDEPELNSMFRCAGFDDAVAAIRARMPARVIEFERAI